MKTEEGRQKKYDVVSLGELLIDFTQSGDSPQGNPLFEANPGGAPANVLSMMQRLSRKTAFIGKVGADNFGDQLEAALKEQGIDTKWLFRDQDVHTTLALVHKLPDGDRDFSFYRNPGADLMLTEEEICDEMFENTNIFHLGSLSMTAQPAKSATIKALQLAKKHGCLITYDPNLRIPLWDSLENAHREIAYIMGFADVLKISDNEIIWFTGKDDYDEGISYLFENFPNLQLIALTLGPQGSRAYWRDIRIEENAFLNPDTVDTTGAGDCFCGCLLNFVLENGLEDITEEKLRDTLTFANAAASLVTTKKGALRVMPARDNVEEYLKQFGK